ncbi:surfeit locus 1 family protein [Limimonas halophila]|uniref:SURF1-like protein n=1 Tax=Limimonas halophila TaxID=1082479 RepID=A0A1G7V5F2_9PROT|nr:SURF1 family protein [Limimonas halophila]SDG54180.1 surfeit locus 1 family protein [Limimonas halophila]
MTGEPGRVRFRPTFWATVAVVPALILLLGLGGWQVQRMQWKQDLIADMRARMDGPAIELPGPGAAWKTVRFRRVELTGEFLHDRALHRLAQTHRGARGFDLITPMRLSDGRTVLVDRGWLPIRMREDGGVPERVRVDGPVTIEGIVRRGGWPGASWLRPANDPAGNEWLWMDLPRMAQQAGLSDPVTHLYVESVAPAASGRFPIAERPRVTLPQNHLGYAITWFGLAAGLLAIYVIFHCRREPSGEPQT